MEPVSGKHQIHMGDGKADGKAHRGNAVFVARNENLAGRGSHTPSKLWRFCTIQPYSMCMLLLGMVYGHLALCLHSVSCGCACGGLRRMARVCACVVCLVQVSGLPLRCIDLTTISSGHGTWRDLGSCISNN